MKYKVSYQIGGDPQRHVRYYTALNKSTALEMFKATCEESLAGESPQSIDIEEVFVAKTENT